MAELQMDGLTVESGKVRLGLFKGLVLEDLVVSLAESTEYPLAKIDHVRVSIEPDRLLAGELTWSKIRLRGGSLSIPLETKAGRETFDLHNITLRLANRENNYEIQTLHGHCGTVRLRVDGRLQKAPESSPIRREDWLRLLAELQSGLGSVPEPIRNYAAEIALVSRKPPPHTSHLDLNVLVPLEDPMAARVDAQLELQQLIWRGLGVERLTVSGTCTPQKLDLTDFRLVLDEHESMRGRVSLSLPDLLLDLDVSARVFPSRLLKVVSSTLLTSPYFPDFQGAPPFWMLQIHQSPLEDLDAWQLNAYLEVKDMVVQKGYISSGRAELAYKDGFLSVRDFRAVMNDRTVCTLELNYRVIDDRLTLNATVNGSPRTVILLTDSAELHRMSDMAWDWFEWQPDAPPHFELTLHRYLRADAVDIMLLGNVRMRGFRFRDQPVDAATARILLDGTNEVLVLQDMRVVRNGKRARGNLAYHFPSDRQSIRFDLDSDLEPDVMLGLIQPTWQHQYRGWQIDTETAAHMQANGWVNLENPKQSHALFTVTVPHLRYQEFNGKSLHARLRYEDGDLSGQLNLASALYASWKGDLLTAEIETDFTTLKAQGSLDQISHEKQNLETVDFSLSLEAGVLTGTASSAQGQVGKGDRLFTFRDAGLDDLRWSTDGLSANLQVTELNGDDLTLHGAQLRSFQLKDGDMSGELQVDRAQAGGASFETLTGQVREEDDRLQVAGDSGEITYRDKASASHASYRLAFGGDQPLEFAIVVPEIKLSGDLRISHLRARMRETEGGYRGVARAEHARLRERLELHDVLADVNLEGGLVQFRSNAARLKAGGLELDDVTCTGNGSSGTVMAEVSSSQGTIFKRYTLDNVRSTLTFQEAKLAFNYLTAHGYDGNVRGNLQVDVDRDTGQAYIVLDNVHLEQMPHMQDRQPDDRIKGKLDGQASLTFEALSSNPQIHGHGEASIRKGEVYRLPVIAGFLDLVNKVNVLSAFISVKDIGAITALDTSFAFQGDRIHFDQVKTNGSLLALSGGGYYWWKTGGLDFRLQAQLLEKVLPVPFANPFRVFLERRAVGSIDNIKWEQLSAIRDVFRDEESPTDPAGTQPGSEPSQQ